ncbi:MAG: hypothetical protein PUD15_08750 [Prevotella sp.]|nr:hypothetical protein [Prevotella sp.]
MFVFVAGLSLTACDDHEVADLSPHIGYVLCDDNSYMDTTAFLAQDTRKAAGVIFALKTEDHPVLAVNLHEISGMFCDTLGLSNGTSGSTAAYDGRSNTTAMIDSYDSKTGHGSPIAMTAQTFHSDGQSEFIPSVAEMRMLIKAAGTINPVLKRLGGTVINTTATGNVDDTWYWTSSEDSTSNNKAAWLCSAANGGILSTLKTSVHKVRSVVEVNNPE